MEKYQILLDFVRQQYASVIWTHRVQEKQAELYARKYRIFETANILAASLTACGIVGTIVQDGLFIKVVTAVLSFITVFIAAYNKSFDLKTLAAGHQTAANRAAGIRNELLQVIAELHMMEKPVDKINTEFNGVMSRLNKLYVEMPTTTNRAVRAARETVKSSGELTWDDAQIDAYLPPALQGKISAGAVPRDPSQTEKAAGA